MTRKISTTLVLAAFFACFTACSPLSGTGTGNPNNAQQGQLTFADSLALSSCSLINKCHGIEKKECFDTVTQLRTFAPKLGLNEPLSMGEISERELLGTLTANAAAANVCLGKLNSLTCESGLVVSSPTASADMLDPDCSEVF